jgi:hypothetical protein
MKYMKWYRFHKITTHIQAGMGTTCLYASKKLRIIVIKKHTVIHLKCRIYIINRCGAACKCISFHQHQINKHILAAGSFVASTILNKFEFPAFCAPRKMNCANCQIFFRNFRPNFKRSLFACVVASCAQDLPYNLFVDPPQ